MCGYYVEYGICMCWESHDIRHLSQPMFYCGWPLKSCTHTGIFPSVSGHPAVKCRLRKLPNIQSNDITFSKKFWGVVKWRSKFTNIVLRGLKSLGQPLYNRYYSKVHHVIGSSNENSMLSSCLYMVLNQYFLIYKVVLLLRANLFSSHQCSIADIQQLYHGVSILVFVKS